MENDELNVTNAPEKATKRNAFEMTLADWERFVQEELDMPRYTADQLCQWIYKKKVFDFRAMTNLSKALRERLPELLEIRLPKLAKRQTAADGTRKYLWRLDDGEYVESVLMDHGNHYTACISSQVGCPLRCEFCATGQQGFKRNLSAGEIVSHFAAMESDVGHDINNVVFMGMGEPLLNLRETTRALEMLNHDKGMDFSPRRITVSTCGIKAGLRELGDSGLAFLAVSLHAPNQELRAKIMPKAANWHLDDLMATLESYPLKTREHIPFEYLLLGGVNDQPEHARELAKLVSRVKGKLNLIAYNPSETQLYKAPTEADILAFEKILWSKGVTAILRKSKGQDIKAACGQLKSDWEREKGDEE